MRIRNKRQKRSHSFSMRLFLSIFSTSFLLLLFGELFLFGASIRMSSDMNTEFINSNLEITAENVKRMLEQVDTSVQMTFSQDGVLEATQKDWNRELGAYETLHHAMKTTMASSDMVCHMSLCSDSSGVLFTQFNGALPYTDAASCRAYFDSCTEGVLAGGRRWYFLERHPFVSKEYTLTNVRNITPIGSDPKELVLVVSVSETKLSDVYEFLGDGSCIMTKNGVIISAVDKELIGSRAEADTVGAALEAGRKAACLKQSLDRSVYSIYLPVLDCYLVAYTPNHALSFSRATMVAIAAAVGTYYQTLQDEGTSVEFEFDAYGIPTSAGAEVPISACWGSYGFCGFGNNGNEEAIKLAMEVWLENPEFQSELCMCTGFISVMSTTAAEYITEHIAEIMDGVTSYTAAYTDSSFGILESWWTDFRGTFYPQLQDYYVGNIDAQTLLDNWQKNADEVIANAN